MNKKFTKDGKKVVVIGAINKTEHIVQEIFVTEGGSEIPSGDNFTAKELFDEPVKSYKENKLASVEATIEKRQTEIKSLEDEIFKLKRKQSANSDMLKRSEFAIKELDNFDWDMFCDIVCGNIKYTVQNSYNGLIIDEFDEAAQYTYNISYGKRKYEGIKSLSLYSRGSGRDCKWKIGNYSDNSGNDSDIFMFRGESDLKIFLLEYLDAGEYSLNDLINISKFIEIDDKYINETIKKEEESRDNVILSSKLSYEKAVSMQNEQLEEKISKLKSLT